MKPRKADMPEVDLLDFVRTCKRVAKQALGKHADEPATGGFARWVHLVTHVIESKTSTATGRQRTAWST